MNNWKKTGSYRQATLVQKGYANCRHCGGTGWEHETLAASDEVVGIVPESEYHFYREKLHRSSWLEETKEYKVYLYVDFLQDCLLEIALGTSDLLGEK